MGNEAMNTLIYRVESVDVEVNIDNRILINYRILVSYWQWYLMYCLVL